MQTKINVQNIKLNPVQEKKVDHVIKKLTSMTDRLHDESCEFRVDLAHEKSRSLDDAYLCVITIFAPRETLRAEARAESLENAIDQVEAKLIAQIEYYKSKMHHLGERSKE
jgi:ribosomal subunit interface protein